VGDIELDYSRSAHSCAAEAQGPKWITGKPPVAPLLILSIISHFELRDSTYAA
jgi:hypothetical protein